MIHRHSYKTIQWIDLEDPTRADIETITQELSLDPHITKELEIPFSKSHFENLGDVILISLSFPAFKHSHKKNTIQNITFLISTNFLITIRHDTSDAIEKFAKSIEVESIVDKNNTDIEKPSSFLFFRMLQELYDMAQNELAFIEDWIHRIEEKVFLGEEREMVKELSLVSRNIIDFRRTIEDHETILQTLEEAGAKMFDENFAHHVRRFLRRYYKIERMVGNAKDAMVELRETNNSLLETRQNEIGKVLAVLAFIAAPLSLLIGILQIETKSRPLVGMENDFWILISAVILAGAVMFAFFKYKKWL